MRICYQLYIAKIKLLQPIVWDKTWPVSYTQHKLYEALLFLIDMWLGDPLAFFTSLSF